jgi:hypothetical protein
MNAFNAKTGEIKSKIDLNNECYAIASNSIDKIAIGGDLNKIDIHTINSNDDISDKNL